MRINGFPEEYSPCPTLSRFLPMSERIRAHTEEAADLDLSDVTYDDASCDFTDVGIDFHNGVMDVMEMNFRRARVASSPEPVEDPKPDPTPEPKSADSADNAE